MGHAPFLGQVSLGHTHLGQPCKPPKGPQPIPQMTQSEAQAFAVQQAAPVPPPTFVSPQGVNCQKMQDGETICSNGIGYANGCPHTPPINVPGTAPMMQQGSMLVPKPPPAPGTPGGDPVAQAPATPAAAPAPAAPAPAGSPSMLLPVIGGVAAGGAVLATLFLTGVFGK